MDGGTSYDDDIYAWAHEQAAVLRRLGETRHDLPNELDLANLAEEIEGVARLELGAAESLIRLMMLHLLKIVSAADARPVRHWRAEVMGFHDQLSRTATPSIIGKVRSDRLWRLALEQAQAQLDLEGDRPTGGLPTACPAVDRRAGGRWFRRR